MEPNFYIVLGVSTTATTQEVKLAYKQLALKYHPDRNPGNIHAEEQFKLVNSAYQTLSSPSKRARYDLRLQYQRHAISPHQTQHGQRFYQTRPPASVSERHYRNIRHEEKRFSRKDWYITLGFVLGLLLLSLLLKVTMDQVTGEDKYKTALAYIDGGKYSSAHRLLTDAITFQPKHMAAYKARATIELNVFEDYDAALQDLDKVMLLQKQPSAEVYFMRGRSNLKLQKYGQAESDFTKALQLNKKLWAAYLRRGQVRLFYLDKPLESIKDLSIFLEHSRNKVQRVEGFTYRGFAYYKNNRSIKAEQDYRQALQLDAENGRVYYLLGRVEVEQQSDSACAHLSKSYQLGYSAALLELRQNCPNYL